MASIYFLGKFAKLQITWRDEQDKIGQRLYKPVSSQNPAKSYSNWINQTQREDFNAWTQHSLSLDIFTNQYQEKTWLCVVGDCTYTALGTNLSLPTISADHQGPDFLTNFTKPQN